MSGLGMGLGLQRFNHIGTQLNYEPESTALFARMTTQPDGNRKTLYNDLIKAGKSHGWWAKGDMLKINAAHDSQASTLNLIKDAHNSIPQNNPTFTTDRGWKGGETAYVDLNYVPSTGGVNYKINDCSFGFCINEQSSTLSPGFGVISSASRAFMIASSHVSGTFGYDTGCANSVTVNVFRELSVKAKGFHVFNRKSSTLVNAGSNFGYSENTVASNGALPNLSMWMCGANASGSLAYGTTLTYSVAWAGGSLSDLEYYHFINDINAFLSSVGCIIINTNAIVNSAANVMDILTGQSNAVSVNGTLAELPVEYAGIKPDRFMFSFQNGILEKQYAPYNTVDSSGGEYFGEEIGFLSNRIVHDPFPAVLKHARSAYNIDNWVSPSGKIWISLTKTITDYVNYCTRNSITPTFRSLLWMQGEQDVINNTLTGYETKLTDFINNIRAYHSSLSGMKIILVKISTDMGLDAGRVATINGIYDSIAGSLANVVIMDVNTMGLTVVTGHYNVASVISIGNEWGTMLD